MVKRCFGADFSPPSFLERIESDRFLVRAGMIVSERARLNERDGGPGYAGGGGGGGGGLLG